MGRAQGAGRAVAVEGFAELLGARRGTETVTIAACEHDSRARAMVKELTDEVASGQLVRALAELTRVGRASVSASPQLQSLAAALAQQAAHQAAPLARFDDREQRLREIGLPLITARECRTGGDGNSSGDATARMLAALIAERRPDAAQLLAAPCAAENRAMVEGSVLRRSVGYPKKTLYEIAKVMKTQGDKAPEDVHLHTLAFSLTQEEWRVALCAALDAERPSAAGLLRELERALANRA